MFYSRHVGKFNFVKKVFLSFSLALMILFVYFYLNEQKPEILEKFNFISVKDFIDKTNFQEKKAVDVKSLLNDIANKRPVKDEPVVEENEEEDLKQVLNNLIAKVDKVEKKLDSPEVDSKVLNADTESKNLNPNVDLTKFPDSPLYNALIFSDKIGITFSVSSRDDGLDEILDILKDWDSKATFFLSPEYFKKADKMVNQILISGHEVGFLYDDYSVFLYNIQQDKKFIESKFGISGIYLIKFLNNQDINFMEVDKLGFRAVIGNLDSEDTKNIATVVLKKLEETKVGDIVNLNVNSENALMILPNYLKILQGKKLTSTMINNLF